MAIKSSMPLRLPSLLVPFARVFFRGGVKDVRAHFQLIRMVDDQGVANGPCRF